MEIVSPLRESVCLALSPDFDPLCLREQWQVDIHPRESMSLTLWDTFEWGLWFGGYVLYSCGPLYHLCGRDHGWPGAVLHSETAGGPRRFWNDFTPGGMRDKLEGILGLRALAAVAKGTFHRCESELRNDLGKIICRIEWFTVTAPKRGGRTAAHTCRILPLTGYGVEASHVRDYLMRRGAEPADSGPLDVLLQNARLEPRKYTLRPAFGLEKHTAARTAVGRIVRTMLNIAVSNIPGIIHDLDTEFLHDYRICLRKIRSLLSLVKDVYPAGETQRLRNILGDLARRTNRLRDLDVHLLARTTCQNFVPPELRPALNGMFEEFSAERESEARRISSHLRSAATRRLLREIEDYFSEQASHDPSPAAEQAIGPLIYRRIYKRYRKIRASAAVIGIDSADETVHLLRIECKKLRYLLEFFAEIMPKQESADILAPLRKLQSRLGDFNDASVQRKTVATYWEETKPAADIALGLGGLVSVLYHRQQEARSLIKRELENFRGASTAAIFKRVFKAPVAATTGATRNPEH